MGTNYLLIAVLALFAILVIRGYRKGFLRIVVSFIGMIVIIFAVRKATPYVSEYLINNTKTYESIQNKVTEKFKEANLQYDNTIPGNQELTINSYDIPDVLKNNLIINNTEEMYKTLLVNLFEEYVSAYMASLAVKALAFVLLFAVLNIAFKILLDVVDLISRIPVLKGFNRLAGALLGFVESLLIVWVVFFLTVMFIGNDSGSEIFKMIAESKLLTFLYNSNVLLGMIS